LTNMIMLEKLAIHIAVALMLICFCQAGEYSLRYPKYPVRDNDYWSEDYDQDKNCASEELVIKIKKENSEYCTSNTEENPHLAIENCKRSLSQGAMSKCMANTQKSPEVGELLYCHSRAQTLCCIHNFTCAGLPQVNENMDKTAARFLKDKDLFLKNLVKMRQYNSCHPIKGLDASKCADECKSLLKTSPLLEHCNRRGGLLKCCVRRDKAFCHECRYCCTLPFCSYKDERGVVIVEGENILNPNKAADQNIGMDAVYELRAMSSMYKGYDNRCLKPDDSKDPELWDHYDPDDFYDATSQEMLDKAKIQKFDKNFFNFEDPEVYRKFTKFNATEEWRQTYGFDFACAFKHPSRASQQDKSAFVRCMVEGNKKCIKASKSSFAANCRKENGIFKCCQRSIWIGVFHETRQKLYSAGLIKKDPADDTIANFDVAWVMTFFCTYKDHLNNIRQKFKSPTINPIGGIVFEPRQATKSRIEFRTLHCVSTNLCLYMKYPDGKLSQVSSKKEFCDLERNVIEETLNAEDKVHGTYIRRSIEPEADCMKRKSPVRICPSKTIDSLRSQTGFNDFNTTVAINKMTKKYQRQKKGKRNKNRSKKKKKKKNKKKRKKRGKKRAKRRKKKE